MKMTDGIGAQPEKTENIGYMLITIFGVDSGESRSDSERISLRWQSVSRSKLLSHDLCWEHLIKYVCEQHVPY